MATGSQRFAREIWGLLILFLLSIATMVLIHFGFHRLENWRSLAFRNAASHWWQFYLAGLIFVLGGLVAGLTIRGTPPTTSFNWRRALALGIMPLFLAMTIPLFVWNWPLSGIGSPLWEFRSHFADDSYNVAAWIVVGLALASGFGATSRK